MLDTPQARLMDSEQLLRLKLPMMREKAWNDLYYFSKYVLGFTDMEEEPHRELCECLMYGVQKMKILGIDFDYEFTSVPEDFEEKDKKLLMLPRGSFKSTVATTAYPTWLLWHNPNLRLMIDSETYHNAKTYLWAIKDQIENNEWLKLICVDENGEYLLAPAYKTAGGWTEEQIILSKRTRRGVKEPNIFCSGADNAKTGMHMEVIIGDDMVSERNVSTPEQIEKVYRHYRMSLSLLEPGGLLIVIGTRYHMDEMYGRLLAEGKFATLVRPAIDDEGKLYFPTRLTQAFLDNMLSDQGVYIYNCQYMLNPLSGENTTFSDETFRFYKRDYWGEDENEGKLFVEYVNEEGKETTEEIIKVEVLTDLAVSMKETACNSVVLPWGITAKRNVFVLDYEADRMLYSTFMDHLFNIKEQYGPLLGRVGLEKVAFQAVMAPLLRDEMRRRGKFFSLFDEKANKKKDQRIQALQPLFESGTIYMKRKHTELFRELIEYPYSKRRDIIDALAYIIQMMRPRRGNSKRKQYNYRPSNRIAGY